METGATFRPLSTSFLTTQGDKLANSLIALIAFYVRIVYTNSGGF